MVHCPTECHLSTEYLVGRQIGIEIHWCQKFVVLALINW